MYQDQCNDSCDESAVTTASKLEEKASPFSRQEWVALFELRRRYQAGHDLWDARELERLRFLRWRYTMGKVES